MNDIPSSLGVFIYAIAAFVLFTLIPLIKYFVKKHNNRKEQTNGE